ncbi:MAG TPA: MaoC/PaaZ C-terminal domain-containing protein [Cellvibrio sp.]|nr:MaoC/PaaZ C-terminal domain-containing protein [Cellvibrio sp.]
MRVIDQLMLTKDRFVRQQSELREYLTHQFRVYRSIIDPGSKGNVTDLHDYKNNKHASATALVNTAAPIYEGTTAANEIKEEHFHFTSDWLVVSQAMIDAFAGVTLDGQWIHTDIARAGSESPYKSTIAHGFLVLSLIPHLSAKRDWAAIVGRQPSMIFNSKLSDVTFLNPLKSNSAIRAKFKTLQIEKQKRGVTLTEEIRLETQSAKTICVVNAVYRVVF